VKLYWKIELQENAIATKTSWAIIEGDILIVKA